MASGGDFWDSKLIEVKQTGALTLSARMNAVFAAAATVLERPANRRFLAFQILADGFWLKPGYHPGLSFIAGDVTDADDTIDETAHGFEAGDGPYQLTSAAPAIVGTPGIIISTTPDILTRDTGSWLTEGFAVNQTITLGGSASNNGALTVTAVTDLVLTVAETLTPEGSQTDLTATATVLAPSGLDALTDYFVGITDDDTFKLYTNQSDAKRATAAVDISQPEMTLTTSVVIDDGPPGTFTRTVGSWLDEGFQAGYPIIVSGSASNEGAFTPSVVTDLVMTVPDTLTSEAAQTDLVITAQYPGGVHTIGAMPAANPTATNTAGQEALHLTATLTSSKVQVVTAADRITVRGDAATSEMVYWWLP